MSTYPGAFDVFPTKSPVDSLPCHAAHHNDLAAAVRAIQTTLGTNPQGAHATVRAAIADARTVITVTRHGNGVATLAIEE
ncbi:MAG: hypothetical protein Q4F67_14590 [Propionibacteriaceae bacterium]|nr:hypothetical protein [Propionibacteriaceae bacterium]